MPHRSLPVLFPAIPDQKWSCHSCGQCCRTLVGHLTPAERDRILEQEWDQRLGAEPVVRAGRSWVLNKRADGACVFLDDQNRCRIHAEFGEAAKPLACRIFPFSVRPRGKSWQASLRFDCPSVTGNQGAPLTTHAGWLEQLVGELSEQESRAEETVRLTRRLEAQPDEVRLLNKQMLTWLTDPTLSMSDRLAGGAALIGQLSDAKLKNVRGDRLDDLVEVLMATIRAELPGPEVAPTNRQRGMLRQAVLAHAEHVSLTDLRSSAGNRLMKRWRQLQAARSMLAGRGLAPLLPGIPRAVAFEQIERVAPASHEAARIEHLLIRYLTARIEGQSIFGDGYYGWTVLEGFAALYLSVAVAGWLARYLAAADGADHIRFQDVSAALGIVDRAATRLPALGTWAERNRIAYLLMDDGLVRLLLAYPMVDSSRE